MCAQGEKEKEGGRGEGKGEVEGGKRREGEREGGNTLVLLYEPSRQTTTTFSLRTPLNINSL